MNRVRDSVLAIFLATVVMPAAAQEDFVLPPIEHFAAMVEHPLFVPNRQGKDAPNNLQASNLHLSGLVQGERGAWLALLFNSDENQVSRVRVGTIVNGWQIAAIDSHGMDITTQGRRVRIKLKEMLPP